MTYKEALQLQEAGKDEQALQKYSELIQANPNIAEVHFQVARIFLRNDRPERGLKHIKAAATLRPEVKDIWLVWSDYIKTMSDKAEQKEFLASLKKSPLDKRLQGQISTAVAFGGRPRVNAGNVPPAAFAAILGAIDAKRYDEAEDQLKRQLAAHPDNPALIDAMAVVLVGKGQPNVALEWSEKAIRLARDFVPARVTYARGLKDLKRAPEGLSQCNGVLRLTPGYPDAVFLRAECYLEMSYRDMAIEDLRRVIDLDPKFERAYYQLAILLKEEFALFDALDVIRKAEKRGFLTSPIQSQKASILADLERPEEALALFEKLSEKNPDDALVQVRIAELRQTLGDFDGADLAFEKSLALDPSRGETYRVQLTSKKIGLDDPRVEVMESYLNDISLSPERRANFGFALSKVMEDNKAYDRVFTYLRPANDLIRDEVDYDIERRVSHDHKVMESFRTVDWSIAPANKKSDFAPIFVTGMPRSGTTLVEQIIASHSSVAGGGEISIMAGRALKMLGDDAGKIIPAAQIMPEKYAELATWYEGYLRRLYPDAPRVTDKSIQTYGWIGPVRLAMPKAKIIVVRRDPRDNLLSIYKNIFPQKAHLYSYSQTHLARMYHVFMDFLALWRELTPDWFYEIHYEDLIANPEEEARKLIAACDLDWEDACLDFHKSDRRVKTLSVYQVRQPIYKSSAKSWERYEGELTELFEALGPGYMDAAE